MSILIHTNEERECIISIAKDFLYQHINDHQYIDTDNNVIEEGLLIASYHNRLDMVELFAPFCTQQDLNNALLNSINQKHTSITKKLLSLIEEVDINNLQAAVHRGDEDTVDLILENCQVPLTSNFLLCMACMRGDYAIFDKILSKTQIEQKEYGDPILFACKGGNIDIVKSLKDKITDKLILEFGFNKACERGHINIVKYLLPFIDPANNHNAPLSYSIKSHNKELFELLLPLSDKTNMEPSIYIAANYNQHQYIDRLFEYCDIKTLKNYMHDLYKYNLEFDIDSGLSYLMRRIKIKTEKDKILKEIKLNTKEKVNKIKKI